MKLKSIKLSEKIVDYLIQALFIFISVFLAFWLNNYQKKKEEIEMTNRAKQVIIEELNANLVTLKRNVAYYQEITFQKNNFLNNGLDTLPHFKLKGIPAYSHGFENFVLSSNALSLANDSRVKLDVKDIIRINMIIEKMEVFKINSDEFDAFFQTENLYDPKLKIKHYYKFYDHITALWSNGDSLLKDIEQTLHSLQQSK